MRVSPLGASARELGDEPPAVVEELLGLVALHPRFEHRAGARRCRARPRAAPGARGTSPRRALRRRPSAPSTPSASAARSQASPASSLLRAPVRPPGSRGSSSTTRRSPPRSSRARASARPLRRSARRSRDPRAGSGSTRRSRVRARWGPEILYPLRCSTGRTAPSRAGFRKLTPFQEPSSGPVSASPSPTTATASEIGVVEDGAERVREHVAELSPFVDRPGRRRAHVARYAAGRRELAKESPHPVDALGDRRVDLRVGPLEVHVREHRRAAVAGPGEEDRARVRARG